MFVWNRKDTARSLKLIGYIFVGQPFSSSCDASCFVWIVTSLCVPLASIVKDNFTTLCCFFVFVIITYEFKKMKYQLYTAFQWTLSWRRPLSYRNQSIDLLVNQWTGFYMITASVMKGLTWFWLDIIMLETTRDRLQTVFLKIWITYPQKFKGLKISPDLYIFRNIPTNIYLSTIKVDNRNTRKTCEICSKLTKTSSMMSFWCFYC